MAISISILCFGCRSLQIQDDDSAIATTGKVGARVLLGAVSLGISELGFRELRVMDSWINAHKSQLIASWGPPNQVFPDGLGGEVYVYMSTYQTPGYSNSHATYNSFTDSVNTTTTYHGGQTRVERKMFYINRDGYIYKWNIQ